MQSAAGTVSEYLEDVPDGRRACLEQLRADCRELLAGFEESMAYGMACYRRPGGEIEVSFASQKQYISLHVLRTDVLDASRSRLTGQSVGKGCVRFRRPEQVDRELVRSMLVATATTSGPVC